MVERGEDCRFALEPGEPIGVRCQRRRQDLQGDLTLQLRVRRAVYLAHAPHADLGDDFIRAEASTRSQGQSCGLYGRNYGRSR